MAYSERGAIEPLSRGETVEVRGIGNSMTPILRSGEVVIVEPLAPGAELSRGDVVIARVHGRVYLHLVRAIRGSEVQIGNNHGHVNGWTPRAQIFGRMRSRAGRP
jgi:phage repressor protein C with HTH and peptisase S24 domain